MASDDSVKDGRSSDLRHARHGPSHGVVVVRQLDGRIGETRLQLHYRRTVVVELEVGELQSVRRRDHHDSIARRYVAARPQLGEYRKSDSRVGTVVHARPIRAGRRIGQLGFGRLLDDAVVPPQCPDGLVYRDGVSDLDGRGLSRGRLYGCEVPVAAIGAVQGVGGGGLRDDDAGAAGMMMTSGTSQSNCWTISIPTVFCPSRRTLFMEFAR